MPDSGKFKDLYLNSALTYPCQPPLGMDGKATAIFYSLPVVVATAPPSQSQEMPLQTATIYSATVARRLVVE